ncbi:Bone morphogenetic protein 1 [Holothuria leucospilota]|uniref:Bone morphogenetic protein 1 n=1 Tax=Holothuria leucospilota TaxID=206669 RepID=A0A9Q1HE73_HOLLE|nr:Bone morphogenetic protein 1 [Holothuria leucospilota]
MGLKFIQCACFGLILINLCDLKAEEISVDSSHNFISENYPSNYPENYNETWCFVASGDSRLRLTFDDIQTEEFFDFITVWESTTASADTLLMRWEGSPNGEPPRVLSSGNNLCLSLQTDSLVNSKGFSGRVDRVSNSFNDDCTTGFDCENGVCLGGYDRCNGFVNCGNGKDEMCTRNIFVSSEERFTSMNYDDGGYVNNHHFTWYFTSNSDMHLELEFIEIDLEESPFDLILVGEGADTSRNLLLTWNGTANASTPVTVRTSVSSMWVQFQSDETDNGRGFSATVRSIDNTQAETCNEFDCENGACIPETATRDRFKNCGNGNDLLSQSLCEPDEMLCFDGRCFSEEARCDGEPNCLTDDDELGCRINVDVKNRRTRKFRDFSQTIVYTNSIPGTHLLINLIFLWTEGRNVNLNLTIGENDLDSSPLLQKNGILNEYVLTQRSFANVLWLKFSVRGALAISVNAVNEGPTLSSCPDNMVVADGDGPAEWSPPFCIDREDGELQSTCSPSSGDSLPNEKNPVTCTCSDSLNSSSSCNFTVTVTKQTGPPVLPLIIGIAVVVAFIVLILAFVLILRHGNRTSNIPDEQTPINRPNEGEEDGHDNPQSRSPYAYADDPEERSVANPQSRVYNVIPETIVQVPARPRRNNDGSTDPGRDYSDRIYNENNIPMQEIHPQEDVPQSHYYSRGIKSSSHN